MQIDAHDLENFLEHNPEKKTELARTATHIYLAYATIHNFLSHQPHMNAEALKISTIRTLQSIDFESKQHCPLSKIINALKEHDFISADNETNSINQVRDYLCNYEGMPQAANIFPEIKQQIIKEIREIIQFASGHALHTPKTEILSAALQTALIAKIEPEPLVLSRFTSPPSTTARQMDALPFPDDEAEISCRNLWRCLFGC